MYKTLLTAHKASKCCTCFLHSVIIPPVRGVSCTFLRYVPALLPCRFQHLSTGFPVENVNKSLQNPEKSKKITLFSV
jgi:hypothetical protein